MPVLLHLAVFNNFLGKPAKIHKRLLTDGKHDLPVDHIIIMDRNVPEADSLLQGFTGHGRDGAKRLKRRKNLTHCSGCRFIRFTDNVTTDINAELNCPCEIQNQNILGIWGQFT